MKKNFRFFDNRQKYLLFVTTTNEKNKIADALKPIVQNLKPKNPALKIFDAGMGDGSLLMSVMRQCHQKIGLANHRWLNRRCNRGQGPHPAPSNQLRCGKQIFDLGG